MTPKYFRNPVWKKKGEKFDQSFSVLATALHFNVNAGKECEAQQQALESYRTKEPLHVIYMMMIIIIIIIIIITKIILRIYLAKKIQSE